MELVRNLMLCCYTQPRTQPKIISIYPWIDFMPGCGTGQLMCVITFDMQISNMLIKNITFTNDKNEKHVHDISNIDGYKYEHRGNEVIIRLGPNWRCTTVTAHITLEYNKLEYVLVSNSTRIDRTS